MRLPRLEPLLSSCCVSNTNNSCVDTCQDIFRSAGRSVMMMIGLFAFIALFGLQDANAQCAASVNDGFLTFQCNSEQAIGNFNTGNYRRFTVANTGQYRFRTNCSGFNSRLTGRNSTGGGGVFFDRDANNSCTDDEDYTWTSSINGTLAVIVEEFNCTWHPNSAILRWRQVLNFTNTTSTATICRGGTKSLTRTGVGSAGSWSLAGGPGSVSGTTYTANGAAGTATVRYSLGVCSQDVAFSVVNDPSISISGAGEVCVGGNRTLTANTSGGTGTCSYQWQVGFGGNWIDLTGATGSSYNTGASNQTLQYRVRRICNGVGCDDPYSAAVTVTVLADPSVTTSGSTTVCVGGNATLSSSASGGTGTCSFQWQIATSSGGTYSNISGATGSTYNTGGLSATRYYRVLRSCTGSGCNTATSNVQQVTVVPDPSVSITTPFPTAICPGQSGTLFASASNGTGSCGFQWQQNSGGGWGNISGATGSSYATGALNTTTTYRVLRSCSGSGCNTATSNQITITVDAIPPTAVCKNISINLNSSGNASISASSLDNGSSDNCGVAGFSASKTSFNCSNVGGNTVTLTVTDVQGNTATCNSTVTVNDVTNPVAQCRNVTIQLNSAGNGSMSESHVNNGSSDACGIANFNTSKTSWNCSNVGNNTVTMVVTDNNGNTSSCTANVNVQDNVNPVALCKNITVQLNHSGNATTAENAINNGSSDACGIANFNSSKTSWNCSNVGNNTVSMTVTDVNGNSSTCSSTVTVQDNIAPDCITKTVTVQLDVNGNGSQAHDAVNNNSFDACGIATFVSSKTTWNCSNVGNNTITLTTTDVNGNVSSCSATIIVEDNVPPTITCPFAPFNNIFRPNDPGSCTATIAVGPPTNVTDACGIATILNDFNGGTDASGNYPIGLTTVTWTATDVNGNQTTCQDFVLVIDTEAPTMVCQNLTVQIGPSGLAFATAAQVDNGSSDNCSMQSLILDRTIFTCADVGTVTATLTGADQSGNQGQCTSTITVEDNINPTAQCNSATVQLDGSGSASIVPNDVNSGSFDNCGIASTVLSQSTFGCADLGANSVTLTVTDNNGRVSTCNATVTVQDLAGPTAVCNNFTVQLNASGNGSITGADVAGGSSDNCGISFISPSPSSFDCNDIGANTVQVFISDVNNNITFCVATVTVEDNIAPSITCPANLSVGTDAGICGAVVNYALPTVSDNCGATLNLVSGPTSGALFPLGTTTVTYEAVDGFGVTATCSFTVTVNDDDAPTAVCNNLTLQLDAAGNASTTSAAVDGGSSDNCGIGFVILSQGTFTCSNVGPNVVTLTVIDQSFSNVGFCTSIITVEDNVDPVAVCQDVTVTLDASGNGSTTAAAVDGGSTDACGIASVSLNDTDFTCADVGANTVQLTATDNNGNTGTCLATVTVEDVTAPNAVCQNITVGLDVNGQAVIVAADVDGGSTDACSVTLSATPLVFNCGSVGPNNVVLTVSDGSGNSSTCTAVVTVQDVNIPGQSPNAACLTAITVQLDASGNAVVTPTMLDDGSFDNCNLTLTVEPSTFGCGDVGANSVSLIGTDDANNSDTCVSTVTIIDIIPPVAVCQDITKALDASGSVSIIATEVDGGSTDACGIAALAVSPSSFSCANVGNNGVTLTVTDNNGNTSSCVAIVTIEDNTPPTASCKDITLPLDATGNGSIFATDVNDGSSDACGLIALAVSPSAFNCTNIGPNTVTLTVTDANFNTSTCTAIVTVEDNVAPVALCTDATVQLDAAGNGSITPGDIDDGSSDACGVAGLSLDISSFTCANVGANTVTLTASDNNGNTATCTATVTVEDNVAPVATCQNVTVQLDASGNGSTTAAAVNFGSSDACGIASLSLDNTSFGCADVGANTVQLTVTDNNGNSSTCLSTVTVQDNVAPNAVCVPFLPVNLDANGNATITAASINAGSNDACGIASLSLDVSSFTCANVGLNAVTLTVTDVNGNSSSCTTPNVLVIDAVAPIAACRDLTVQLDATGNGSITPNDVDNGSSDACGIASLTLNNSSFTCANVGANTVVLTVTDNNNQSSTCSATITVEDNVAPVATCQNITIQLDAAGDASITAGSIDGGSSDACGIASTSASKTSFGCGDVGGNPVTLTVVDNNGNSSNCIAIVNVEDNVAPVAACQDVTVQLNAAGAGSITTGDVDGGSSDACGIAGLSLDVTDFDCSDVGGNTVTLTATDANGNSSTCTATITVEDNVAPIAICQNITVQLDAAGNASITPGDIDNGSSDACGLAGLSVNDDSFNCIDVGNNTITLTATDVNGNSTSCTAVVTVEDNVAPVALCQDLTIQLDASGQASITANDVDNGSSDACGIASLSLDNTLFLCTNVGATTVTLTATDVNGNATTCTATITTEDNVDPVANCRNVNVLLDASGNASITPGDVNDGSSDACGIASLSLDVTSFNCSNVGSNPVTLTVTDNNGNVSTCGALAIVVDAVPPVAECQNLTIQLDAAGEASIVAEDIDNGSTDACGVASLALDITAFTCAEVGPNTVTLTVTDVNGNASTCTGTVTVEDNVAPIALCQTAVVELDAAGLGGITTGDIDAGSNDACGIASVSLDITDFTCANVGSNTVVLTVVDNNGNSSSCSTTVLVNDNVAPVAICQDITVQLDALGSAGISTGDVDDGSNDACGIASYNLDINSFDCSDVGPNTVTLTVIDNNSNVSSCTATVEIEDNVAPVAICQDIVLQLNNFGQGEIASTDIDNGSNDACGIASLVLDNLFYNCSDVGANTVTMTVTDVNDNVSSCSATVTVEDNIEPEMFCKDITVQLDAAGTASIVPGDVDDGSNDACGIATYSLDISSFVCSTVGPNTVELTATDVNGNSSTCTAEVTVEDNVAPVALCQDVTVDLDVFGEGSITTGDIDAGSNDACGVTGLSLDILDFDCSNVGSNTVTLTVTDINNNVSTCTAEVTVEDNIAPVIICQDITVQLDGVTGEVELASNPFASPNLGDAIADLGDACGIQFVFADITEFDCSNVGPNTILITAIDNNGNTSACNAEITVEDVTAPAITCPADITVIADSNDCDPQVFWTVPTPFDACGQVLTSTHNPGDEFPLGTTTVTYTSVDPSGNTTTCDFTITVNPKPLTVTLVPSVYACGYNVTCNGASDGTIAAPTAGGCLPYSYLWSDGQTTETATGLTAGTYSVTVSSPSGQTVTDGITLTEPDALASTLVSTNVTCFGFADGTIDLTVTGGCAPYTYSWVSSGFNASTEDLTNLAPGLYKVVITDQNGCTTFNQVLITEPPLLEITSLTSPTYIGGYNITCNGANDGSIDLEVTGGTPAYTYAWAGPAGFTASTQDLSGLAAGTYDLTLTDANGCLEYGSITLTEPDVLVTSLCDDQTVVFGYYPENVADISSATIGGVGPYTYAWSNGETTPQIQVSPVVTTTFSVTVNDVNGCENVLSHTVTVIDIRCGNNIEFVSMCDHKGDDKCVKVKDVPNKLADGWTLGVCGSNIDLDHGNCGDPVIPGCGDPNGDIVFVSLEYNGPSGVDIDFYQEKNNKDFITGYTNVQNGDVLNVDPVLAGYTSFPSHFWADIDGQDVEIESHKHDGKFEVGLDPTEHQTGEFVLLAWADENGNSCDESNAALACECKDQIKLLLVKFRGPSGTDINVYEDPGNQALFQTFNNVQNGDTMLINGTLAGGQKLNAITSFEQIGSGQPLTLVPTDCKEPLVGRVYGDYEILGWADKKDNACGELPAPCPCNNRIVWLGTIYDGPAGGTIIAYAKDNHKDTLGIFINLNPGDTIVVGPNAINKDKLEKETYFELAGAGQPDMVINTECQEYIEGRDYGSLTTFGYIDEKGVRCHLSEVPGCPCEGGVVELTVEYDKFDAASLGVVTINAFADAAHTQPLGTFTGIEPGDDITVSGAGLPGGTLNVVTYFELVGIARPDIKIVTDCGKDITGDVVNELFVVSYEDSVGNFCESDCGLGKTLMCHTSDNKGPHTHCVKNNDVAKKLTNADWAVGPCPVLKLDPNGIVVQDEDMELIAYPNPFSTTATIQFRLPVEGKVDLTVYGVNGAEVANLYSGDVESGRTYRFTFEGESTADAVYFYRLQAPDGKVYNGKLMMIK